MKKKYEMKKVMVGLFALAVVFAVTQDVSAQKVKTKAVEGFGGVIAEKYIYFAPGAVRIAEKSSAPVKNRSHMIETTIELKGHEEGVICAVGGMTGGFTMFIKGGKLYYDYNFLDGVYYTMASPPLPEGKTDLKFNFIKTKEFGGKGELHVNGEKVAENFMPQMHISTYSLAETFDVGRDTGTQMSRIYAGDPFIFNGKLDRVTITLTD